LTGESWNERLQIARALPEYLFKPILGFPTMQKTRRRLRLKDKKIATG
jgi:hypothetical protein